MNLECRYKALAKGILGNMAEEVGVEPTRRLLSVSTALKAARPTGDDTLPQTIRR